jgi:hypothetical protein
MSIKIMVKSCQKIIWYTTLTHFAGYMGNQMRRSEWLREVIETSEELLVESTGATLLAGESESKEDARHRAMRAEMVRRWAILTQRNARPEVKQAALHRLLDKWIVTLTAQRMSQEEQDEILVHYIAMWRYLDDNVPRI